MTVDGRYLIELAKANGFSSVTEAITVAHKATAEVERLNKLQITTAARAELAQIEIERLRSIIKKQMSPTEISRRLAACNELADAYAEQNTTIKELRAEIERLQAAIKL